MYFSEIAPVEMRVDGGSGHRRVTEQLLHDPEVGAALEQMSGERMPQRVGVNGRCEAGITRVAAQDLPESHPAQGAAARVHEDEVVAPSALEEGPAALEPGGERASRRASERNH